MERPAARAPKCASRQKAFTLIELSVVIALIAALMGVALFQMRGPYRRARRLQNVAELKALDQLVRRRASQMRSNGRLVVDRVAQQVQAFGPQSQEQPLAFVSLARVASLHAVWLSGIGKTTDSPIVIPVGPRGQTPSYAFQLKNSPTDTRWLLFTARTGQVVEVANQRELERVLQPSAP